MSLSASKLVERERELVVEACARARSPCACGDRLLRDGADVGLVVDGPQQLEEVARRERLGDEHLAADDAVQLRERGVRVGDVVQALEQDRDVDRLVLEREVLRAARRGSGRRGRGAGRG